jgi:hypothetical protein
MADKLNALAAALMGTNRPGPTNALAQTMAKRLSPQQEHEYNAFMAFDPSVRQWRNAFTNVVGGPPNTEGGDFDYRAAYLAGSRPAPVPGDPVPHWGSAGKSADHPTMWKQQFMTQFGVDPDTPGLQYSPQMQEFIRRQIGQEQPIFGSLAPPRGLF